MGTPGTGEGTVIVTYALAKVGKTLDALYSAPTAHVFTTAPRQLEGWRLMTGVKPKEHRIDRLKGVAAKIRQIAAKEPGAVFVFDDASIAAKREELALLKAGKVGWSMWKLMNRVMSDIREACIDTRSVLWFIFHEKAPKFVEETVLDGPPKLVNGIVVTAGSDKASVLKSPGCPLMPSEAMSAEIPAISPLVLRGTKRKTSVGGWRGTYYCNPENTEWITGERWCILPEESPMNVREILWQAHEKGHDVLIPPRAPGLGWLDDVAERVADGLEADRWPTEDAAAKALGLSGGGRDPRHLRWAWRDACARVHLRKGSGVFNLFTPPSSVAGTGMRIPG